jgi:pyridoxine kinase
LKILSVHSAVAWGRVGNSALTLPLGLIGCEVVAVNTTRLAHHPGYGAFRGAVEEPAVLTAIVEGLGEVGALDAVDGMLSGYLGDARNAEAVLAAHAGLRSGVPYLCDPVLGDADKGVYVRPGVVEAVRDRLAPEADILTPNLFELGLLAGSAVTDETEAITAARSVIARGPSAVAVTSAPAGADRTGILLVTGDAAWSMTTPLIACDAKGTGDLFAALLLHGTITDVDIREAAENALRSVWRTLERTRRQGLSELAVLPTGDDIATPDIVMRRAA